MVVNEKNEGTNEPKQEDDMDRIERLESPEDQTCIEGEERRANRGAGQVAKDLFKVLFETINLKYKQSDDTNNLLSPQDVNIKNDEDRDIKEHKNLEENLFEHKLNNMLGFFVNIMKSPKSDVMDRVRRKSSCFWSEASPSDFSREETAGEVSPEEEEDENTNLLSNSDEKMETFEEFLKQSERLFRINAKQNAGSIHIQRKMFKKPSTDSTDKPFVLKDVIDLKKDRRRKSSTTSRILKRKQKSLDEGMLKVNRDVIRPNVEKKTSLVEYRFIREMSGSFTNLLRRFSHESVEIEFIDESPDFKQNDNERAKLVMKSQDSIDSGAGDETIFSKRSSFRRADTGSKLNMLIESKIAIARPENFELSPEEEQKKVFQKRDPVRVFKDMGTSCDLIDQCERDRWSLTSGNSHDEEEQDSYLIKPDQLAELRRCAEIIFKEVQGNLNEPKPSGVSVDIQCDVTEIVIAENDAKDTIQYFRSGLEMINESFETEEHEESHAEE